MIQPAHPGILASMGGNSGRFVRSLRQLRDARATWLLVRILLWAQSIPVAWDLIVPGASKLFLAQQCFGITQNALLTGSLWQPFTYAFIHANWFHLLANAASILVLGSKLEHIISKRTLWLLVLFSVLAGGLLFILLSPAPDTVPQTLVGSSAICFGFLVLLTTLSPDSKFLPLFLSGRSIGIAIIISNLVLTILNPDLPTGILAGWGKRLADSGLHSLFQVSHACHLGGSLAGFIVGKYLLRPRVSLASLKRARQKLEAAADSKKASSQGRQNAETR